MCHRLGIVDPTNLLFLRKSCILSQRRSSLIEGFVAVVRSKNAPPTWSDVKTALLAFDRAGLQGLVQDLYTANKENQVFLHARLGLGHDQRSSPSKHVFLTGYAQT